jgi:hypothetical protein
MGPSYPLSCALLRFDPERASVPTDEHPSSAARLSMMRATLVHMDGDQPAGDYQASLRWLDEGWSAVRAGQGGGPGIDRRAARALEPTVDWLYGMLSDGLAAVRCRGLSAAWTLGKHLDGGRLPAGADIRDVVNAAWLRRCGSWRDREAVEAIGERALRACLVLAAEKR